MVLTFFLSLSQDYTNANNPFGDHHLLEKFVWGEVRKGGTSLNLPVSHTGTKYPETEAGGVGSEAE